MRIDEVEITSENAPGSDKLMALVQFLSGRAENTNATKQISQDAFINLAQSLGINVTSQNINDMVIRPPLSQVLDPIDPNSVMVTFKVADIGPSKMSVPQSQQVVNKMAKSAMKR